MHNAKSQINKNCNDVQDPRTYFRFRCGYSKNTHISPSTVWYRYFGAFDPCRNVSRDSIVLRSHPQEEASGA